MPPFDVGSYSSQMLSPYQQYGAYSPNVDAQGYWGPDPQVIQFPGYGIPLSGQSSGYTASGWSGSTPPFNPNSGSMWGGGSPVAYSGSSNPYGYPSSASSYLSYDRPGFGTNYSTYLPNSYSSVSSSYPPPPYGADPGYGIDPGYVGYPPISVDPGYDPGYVSYSPVSIDPGYSSYPPPPYGADPGFSGGVNTVINGLVSVISRIQDTVDSLITGMSMLTGLLGNKQCSTKPPIPWGAFPPSLNPGYGHLPIIIDDLAGGPTPVQAPPAVDDNTLLAMSDEDLAKVLEELGLQI